MSGMNYIRAQGSALLIILLCIPLSIITASPVSSELILNESELPVYWSVSPDQVIITPYNNGLYCENISVIYFENPCPADSYKIHKSSKHITLKKLKYDMFQVCTGLSQGEIRRINSPAASRLVISDVITVETCYNETPVRSVSFAVRPIDCTNNVVLFNTTINLKQNCGLEGAVIFFGTAFCPGEFFFILFFVWAVTSLVIGIFHGYVNKKYGAIIIMNPLALSTSVSFAIIAVGILSSYIF